MLVNESLWFYYSKLIIKDTKKQNLCEDEAHRSSSVFCHVPDELNIIYQTLMEDEYYKRYYTSREKLNSLDYSPDILTISCLIVAPHLHGMVHYNGAWSVLRRVSKTVYDRKIYHTTNAHNTSSLTNYSS